MYAEHRAEQLFLNSVCVPRGAVPSHTSLDKVAVNYFSFKASVFFEYLIKIVKPKSRLSSN